MKTAPKTPLKKRLVFALYLVQPVLQFFVLVAALGLLNRCSPLAPSTEKSSGIKVSAPAPAPLNDRAQAAAEEAKINESLQQLTDEATAFLSTTEIEKLFAKTNLRAQEVNDVIYGKKTSQFARVVSPGNVWISLTEEQISTLAEKGKLRLDLREGLRSQDFHYIFPQLKQRAEQKSLRARRFVAFHSETLLEQQKEEIAVVKSHLAHLNVSLALLDDDVAVLEVRLAEAIQYHEAFKPALRNVNQLAIVLE